MKTHLHWLTVAVIGTCFVGCSKNDTAEVDEPEEEAIVEVTPTPPPVVQKTEVAMAEPTPAPPRLAPEGVFFLLVKKSVESDDGIIGLSPGTKLQQQPDGTFAFDGMTVAALPQEITNDLDRAARAAGADARAQMAIRQTMQARIAAAPAPPRETERDDSASSSGRTSLQPAAARAPMQSTSSLGATHTRTKDGWLWERDAGGEWTRVRPTR